MLFTKKKIKMFVPFPLILSVTWILIQTAHVHARMTVFFSDDIKRYIQELESLDHAETLCRSVDLVSSFDCQNVTAVLESAERAIISIAVNRSLPIYGPYGDLLYTSWNTFGIQTPLTDLANASVISGEY